MTVPVDKLDDGSSFCGRCGTHLLSGERCFCDYDELVARATQAEADREPCFVCGEKSCRPIWDRHDIKRFREEEERNLARLREERDAAIRGDSSMQRTLAKVCRNAERIETDLRAAEARCARLRQALKARHRWLADALSRNQIVHETDRARARAFIADWEALAGPDTPADSQEDKT